MVDLLSRWLERGRLGALMGTFTLAILMCVTPHFFLDMLLLTSYHAAQNEFQRFYLCIHIVCCGVSFLIIVYSFWAMSAQTYHAICNMRSWSLLIGLFMFFSGFFSTLGFALDWHKFRDECTVEVDAGEHAAADYSASHAAEVQHCREIWDALLTTNSVLWAITAASFCSLVICLDRFKYTHFAEQEQEKHEQQKIELFERYQAQGMADREAVEKVEVGNWRSIEQEEEEVFAEMGRIEGRPRLSQQSKMLRKPTRSFTMPFLPRHAMSLFAAPKATVQSDARHSNDISPSSATLNNSLSANPVDRDGVFVLPKVKLLAPVCESPEIIEERAAVAAPSGWLRAADPDEITVLNEQSSRSANTALQSPAEQNRLLGPTRPEYVLPTILIETPNGTPHSFIPRQDRRAKPPLRSLTMK